jgi:hypothetical protein
MFLVISHNLCPAQIHQPSFSRTTTTISSRSCQLLSAHRWPPHTPRLPCHMLPGRLTTHALATTQSRACPGDHPCHVFLGQPCPFLLPSKPDLAVSKFCHFLFHVMISCSIFSLVSAGARLIRAMSKSHYLLVPGKEACSVLLHLRHLHTPQKAIAVAHKEHSNCRCWWRMPWNSTTSSRQCQIRKHCA